MTACMTELELRPAETCAVNGMVVQGMVNSDVQCRRLESPTDQCELAAAFVSLRNRQDYGTGGRNTLLFAGYVFWILPGILLHIAFNHERDGITADLDVALAAEMARCGALPRVLSRPGD